MNGWLGGQAVALLLTLTPGAAGADERAYVYLCGLSSADEVRAAAVLDDILATAHPESGDPGVCDGPPTALRASLVSRGPGQVALLLEGPAMTLERLVPWLSMPDDGLAALERKGRLASFAILLEALLAEYRLTLAVLAAQPALPEPEPAPKPVAESARAAPRPKPRVAVGSEPAPSTRPEPKPAPPSPSEPESAPRLVPDLRPEPEPEPLAPDPPPEPEFEDRSARPPIRRGADVTEPGGDGRRRSVAPPPVPEVFGGIRIRAPGMVGAEYGVGLRIGSGFVAARLQPGVDWTVENRPLSVSALGLELGWLPPLWSGDDGRVVGRAAVLGERLGLRQLDLEGKADHQALDVGVEVGVVFERRLIDGLWASAGIDGIWSPTAGELVIEDERKLAMDYVRVRFNGAGARATLTVFWQR